MSIEALTGQASRYLTPENLGMSGLIFLALAMANAIFPRLKDNATIQRLMPFIPEVLGVVIYELFPKTLGPENAGFGELALIGIVVGTASSKVHKIVRQTVLGKDKAIEAKRERKKASVGSGATEAVTEKTPKSTDEAVSE